MLKFVNSFSTDLIEIRCLHNDEKKLPGKFVVLDKMDAVAQAGHMTNEYSKYKAIHVLYAHPGKNNLRMLRALAVCSCSVLSALAAGKYEHVLLRWERWHCSEQNRVSDTGLPFWFCEQLFLVPNLHSPRSSLVTYLM